MIMNTIKKDMPKHLAIIMDGNGRWAESMGKNRIHGQSKWKNNAWNFFNHIFFNFLYLIKLRFTNVKK